MSNTELKPCPFCGGEAELVEQKHREYPSTYYITCKGYCIRQHKFNDKESAIEAWNTRKPMERIVEQLEEEIKKSVDRYDNKSANCFDIAQQIVQKGGAEC